MAVGGDFGAIAPAAMAEPQRKAAAPAEGDGEGTRQKGGEDAGEESSRGGGAAPAEADDEAAAVFYKTKVVEFLGRSTPIILQNDNGPCPLLAICNVLLLRNIISLSLDTPEVSQQKLLSLVAERLLDSNSNVEGKDEGYIQNQQRNISDAIDLLPRLASGIDVNVLFRKINDFEFTPECAIFDLLDIGLYHGWIVDPQDDETATAIGSKSYNALVGELVTLDTRKPEGEKHLLEDNSVDFAAATTAVLGVPSPSLSRSISCNDSPISGPDEHRVRRGDIEEEEELMRVLKLSRAEQSTPVTESLTPVTESLSPDVNFSDVFSSSEESTVSKSYESGVVSRTLTAHDDAPEKTNEQELLPSVECNKVCDIKDGNSCLRDTKGEMAESSTSTTTGSYPGVAEGAGAILTFGNSMKAMETESLTQEHSFYFHSLEKKLVNGAVEDQSIPQQFVQKSSTQQVLEHTNNLSDDVSALFTSQVSEAVDFLSPPGSQDTTENFSLNQDTTENFSLSPNEIEPLYEGEECILDSVHPGYENHEPVYEGEVVLAKQADQGEEFAHVASNDTASHQQWHLIRNFLKDNASQLTVYGLVCLHEGLKERELGVFFRNNHFGTMFKYNGDLYLLATDQGYINQQDLVWEKLNEVNGDTVFMTGNFKEFMAENQASHSWDEQNALNEYLALEGSTSGNATFDSDHQLAMELQKQEFEKQPQRQQPQKVQQSSVSGRSRLVTGPQVSRHSANSSQRQDSKAKDKCSLM